MFKFLSKNIFDVNIEPFGLDLSDGSFKFIKFSKEAGAMNIDVLGYSKIKDGLIKHGEIQDEDALSEILKDGFKRAVKGKLKSPYVVCSLPEENSFIRILQMPKMSEGEMKEAVKWEIEQNIPLGIDEVYFDWHIISNKSTKINHQDILVSAISKKIADPYVSVLKKSGLVPVAMEVESISLVRSLVNGFKADDPILIVDIGAIRSTFVIFSGDTIRFSSSVSLAGDKMMDAILKNLKVDEKEAHRLFFDVGIDESLDNEGRVKKAIDPILSKILKQIEDYLSFYTSHSMHDHSSRKKSIKKIILSGGVSNLYGLSKYVSFKTKITVEIANPWVNVFGDFSGEIPEISHRESLKYSIAIGLALRNFEK